MYHCNRILWSKGRFSPWKISIGSDRTGLFSILYYPHRRTKKVQNTSTFYHRITGSNWNRKLVPKAHARVQFYSDPVRSHAYFPEWKPALRLHENHNSSNYCTAGFQVFIYFLGTHICTVWCAVYCYYLLILKNITRLDVQCIKISPVFLQLVVSLQETEEDIRSQRSHVAIYQHMPEIFREIT